MKSDLSNVKVGDKIWTIQEGWTEVEGIVIPALYTFRTEKESYTLDGRYEYDDKHPSAFLENPFEKEITREVEEEIIKGFIKHYNILAIPKIEFEDSDYYLEQKYKPLPTKEEFLKSVNLTEEEVKQIMEFKNIAYKA